MSSYGASGRQHSNHRHTSTASASGAGMSLIPTYCTVVVEGCAAVHEASLGPSGEHVAVVHCSHRNQTRVNFCVMLREGFAIAAGSYVELAASIVTLPGGVAAMGGISAVPRQEWVTIGTLTASSTAAFGHIDSAAMSSKTFDVLVGCKYFGKFPLYTPIQASSLPVAAAAAAAAPVQAASAAAAAAPKPPSLVAIQQKLEAEGTLDVTGLTQLLCGSKPPAGDLNAMLEAAAARVNALLTLLSSRCGRDTSGTAAAQQLHLVSTTVFAWLERELLYTLMRSPACTQQQYMHADKLLATLYDIKARCAAASDASVPSRGQHPAAAAAAAGGGGRAGSGSAHRHPSQRPHTSSGSSSGSGSGSGAGHHSGRHAHNEHAGGDAIPVHVRHSAGGAGGGAGAEYVINQTPLVNSAGVPAGAAPAPGSMPTRPHTSHGGDQRPAGAAAAAAANASASASANGGAAPPATAPAGGGSSSHSPAPTSRIVELEGLDQCSDEDEESRTTGTHEDGIKRVRRAVNRFGNRMTRAYLPPGKGEAADDILCRAGIAVDHYLGYVHKRLKNLSMGRAGKLNVPVPVPDDFIASLMVQLKEECSIFLEGFVAERFLDPLSQRLHKGGDLHELRHNLYARITAFIHKGGLSVEGYKRCIADS